MAHLPQFQDSNTTFQLMQSKWSNLINPVLEDPTNQGTLLKNISIVTGVNNIAHKLGRSPQGWVVVDQTAAITLFRSQPFNSTTLTLTASGPATIALWVF